MNQRTRLAIRRLQRFGVVAALLITFVSISAAQSTDPDSPTPMTTNVVTGKSNGKAKTVYYSFTATGAEPGEVTVNVTASTDERSTNLRVNFLDAHGQKVMDEIYVIPNRDPATKIGRHTFADRQKVIMRVTLPDDPQVKLLNYKIEVSGAVEFEQSSDTNPTASTTEGTKDASSPASDPAALSSSNQASAEEMGQEPGANATTGNSLKNTVKQKAKEKAQSGMKKAANKTLDKFPL